MTASTPDRAPAIRRAAAGDLDGIRDLLRRSALPDAGLEPHLGTTLVARDGDRIAGCAALEVHGSAALLRSVAVDPAGRGTGLGVRLTGATLGLARELQLARVYLLTTTAAGFFPRFGFRPVPRDQVDPAVRESEEFTGLCPASAVAMVLDLGLSPSPPSPGSSPHGR